MLLDKLKEKLARKSAMTDETQELLNNVKISNKNKIVRKIATFVLAGAMVLAPLGLAACKTNSGTTTPTEQTQTGNNNGSTNNNNGNNNNNNGNNNQGGNSGGNKDDETTEFSDILSNILTEENRDLWQKVYDNGLKISNDVKPIPYKFLRNHGHNVDAYLDGTLDVFASSYIYDNDKNHIYVSVKAENVSNSQYGNYYTNYVLKYPLTDQEYDEYTYLCEGEYVQGLYYIQELDNQKTPEVLSKVNIAKTTYDSMAKEFPDLTININKYDQMDIDISFADLEKICISIREKSSNNLMKNEIGFVDMGYKKLAWPEIYNYDAIYIADPTAVKYDIEPYQSSLQNITSFSYGTHIGHTNPYDYYEVKRK